MKLRDLLAGVPLTGGTADLEMEINSISYDSRTVEPGGLFVAVHGSHLDGENYVDQALERGAAAALCAKEGAGPRCLTSDPSALATVCANWYGHPAREMTVIGVTGTNGKTTTTFLIKTMLERSLGATVGLIGTIENRIGGLVLPARRTTPGPLELQRLLRQMADRGCTHVVMEVSSHALAQHRVDAIPFAVGVFTNLTQDHLDYHKTMEAYRQAKKELLLRAKQAVVNLDDETGRLYCEQLPEPPFTYSENKDCAQLTAKNIRLFASHVEFEAVALGQISRVHLPIPGGFTIYNALAALSVGLCLGIPLERAAASLRSASGVKGRVEVVPTPTAYTVLIDYAHTPDALENILTTARDFTAGRLICLFGCGGDRDRTKRSIMGGVVAELADLAVVTSDNPRSEEPGAIIRDILAGMGQGSAQIHVEPDRPTAIGWALEQARPGDVVVLAGKGHETYQEIGGRRIPMDERQIVAEWFGKAGERRDRASNYAIGVI